MTTLILILLAVVAVAPFAIEARRRPMDDRTRAAAPGQFLPLDNGLTHVRLSGPKSGPLVVCIHGLTTPSFVWDAMAEGLTQAGYRVLRYDLFGRGFSDRPDGEQDRAFFLTQLTGVLDGMGVKGRFTLIGYSMGGTIATAYAAANPERVRHLVLLAPGGLALSNPPIWRAMRSLPILGEWLALGVMPWLFRRELRRDADTPSAVPNIAHRIIAETEIRGYAPAVQASLKGILSETQFADHQELELEEVPALGIWGEEDDVIPLRAMGLLTQANRAAEQVMIKHAGHGLPYTHPREVLEATLSFLTRH